MGRKSKLTDRQWEEIGKRYLAGEKGRVLAREFEVSEGAIRLRFSAQCAEIKTVAAQVYEADKALNAMPISAQIATLSLVNDMRSISNHLSGAARYGAATAHRLAGIANAQVEKIDDVNPMESQEVLQGISALTKMSNEAAVTGIALLNANKGRLNAMDDKPADTAKPINWADVSDVAIKEVLRVRDAVK